MAWIESHQELGAHPKVRKLARVLAISRPAAIGHLHYLWWWALDYAQDGDISRYDLEEIAEAALWEGDPQVFFEALAAVGFLDLDADGARTIHDWHDYAGRLLQQRRANADKQRAWRDRHKDTPREVTSPPPNRHVTVTYPSRNGATVPNHTVPNHTKEDDPTDHLVPPERPDTVELPPDTDVASATVEKPLTEGAVHTVMPTGTTELKSARPRPAPTFADDSMPMRLARYFATHIQAANPYARIPANLSGWAAEFDRCIRLDKAEPTAIRAVIDYAASDTFWRGVVLSAAAVRKHYPRLRMQLDEQQHKEQYHHERPAHTTAAHTTAARAERPAGSADDDDAGSARVARGTFQPRRGSTGGQAVAAGDPARHGIYAHLIQ